MCKIINIDSTKGGNGDIWMRLVSFYSVAALLTRYKICIKIPSFFEILAKNTFGDRLEIVSTFENNIKVYEYSNLGMKDLLLPIINGKRFIVPYQKAVIFDKKKREFKDYINLFIFSFANSLGFALVPPKKYIPYYQGYLDIVAIPPINKIGYEYYVEQLKKDQKDIYNKLEKDKIPFSAELSIPEDLKHSTLVFPSGSGRQFIPLWWAKIYMPNAYYAFFFKDPDRKLFTNEGLKVIYFYNEPGDIIYLSHKAKWTISTDSFPSHLLQFSKTRCTIVLSVLLKSRTVSPVFLGNVVESVAPCYPCLHTAKNVHPLCAAGYTECLNWKSSVYTKNVLNSILH